MQFFGDYEILKNEFREFSMKSISSDSEVLTISKSVNHLKKLNQLENFINFKDFINIMLEEKKL